MTSQPVPKALWSDIRPYLDDEVHEAVERLLADPEFVGILQQALPAEAEQLKVYMMQADSIKSIKIAFGYRIVRYILQKTAFSCDLSGSSNLGGNVPATYISNHRDIILDAGILNVLLADKEYKIPRIAIGDNLFARPWIKEIVRLMDSVTVKRAASQETSWRHLRLSLPTSYTALPKTKPPCGSLNERDVPKTVTIAPKRPY